MTGNVDTHQKWFLLQVSEFMIKPRPHTKRDSGIFGKEFLLYCYFFHCLVPTSHADDV